MKDPAFLFYYQDFLVGASFMSLEERGAYITLLCFQAHKGVLAENEILKKIPTPIWEAIREKFEKDENGYFNKRLRKEMEKRSKFVNSRLKNLHKAADTGSHMGNHMESRMENENEIENIKSIERTLSHNNKYIGKADIEKMCVDKLGKMATTPQICTVLKEVPVKMWWVVDKFLKKTYPASPEGYNKAVEAMKNGKGRQGVGKTKKTA